MVDDNVRRALANAVAGEISLGFSAYRGRRWRQTPTGERATDFAVPVPSLKGLKLSQVGFRSLQEVYGVSASTYQDGAGITRSRRLLHGIHFTLQAVDGTYTGEAIVSEAT